ncbi:hypothetical protein ACFL1P_00650 [Patescibacteria group bacterium]
MKNKLPFIIVAVIVLIGGYYLYSQNNASVPGEKIMDKISGDKASGESFSGPLKMAFEKGIPLSCSWKGPDGMEVSGKVKGKQYRGTMTQQGKEVEVIMNDTCMWTWENSTKEGIKMCFESDPWEMSGGDMPDNVNCLPGIFGDNEFSPPADVTFMDIDKMGQ